MSGDLFCTFCGEMEPFVMPNDNHKCLKAGKLTTDLLVARRAISE